MIIRTIAASSLSGPENILLLDDAAGDQDIKASGTLECRTPRHLEESTPVGLPRTCRFLLQY